MQASTIHIFTNGITNLLSASTHYFELQETKMKMLIIFLMKTSNQCSVVCSRDLHLPGNPKMVWHPYHFKKEGRCVDLSMDTIHIKDPLVSLNLKALL